MARAPWDDSRYGSNADLRFENFAFRYVGASEELDAIVTDLLIVEASTDLNAEDDAPRTAAEVAALTDDATIVYAYMSIGAVDLLRSFNAPGAFAEAIAANAVTVDGAPDLDGGALWLQFWAPELKALYSNWARDLATQGYDGAFIDVVDSWYRPSVLATAPGETDAARKLFAIDAMMRIVLDAATAAEAVNPNFEIMLGHTPLLLRDYLAAAAETGAAPDQALVGAFKAEIDALLIEGPDIIAAMPEAAMAAQTDWGDNTALLALGYFPGAYDGDPDATARAQDFLLSASLVAGEDWSNAFTAYAAPTDRRAFDATYALAGADAGVAITSGRGLDLAKLRVPENSVDVTTVVATGAAPLSYAIIGGADAALFTIDAATGVVRFAAAPDFEAPADANGDNSYEVIVRASDGLGGADAQALQVRVSNVVGAEVYGSSRRNDTLVGTGEEETLWADRGNDTLSGLGGDDQLWGEWGNDTLDGGAGNDLLIGGEGDDVLTGGAGADRFFYESDDDGRDLILDFEDGVDVIDLSDVIWRSATFVASDAAFTDANQVRVSYVTNESGERTLVEVNTDRGSRAELVIELVGHHELSAADFLF